MAYRTDEVILAEFDNPRLAAVPNGDNVDSTTDSTRQRLNLEVILANRELLQEIKDVLGECREELQEIKENTAGGG